MITIDNVTKIYTKGKKHITALKDINLSIPTGSVVGFLGSNGAGKTTLIKILCNLITPTYGTVLIDGESVQRNPSLPQKKIGVVLEGARNLYNFLSIEDNLKYFSLLNSMEEQEFISTKERLLSLFQLDDKRKSIVNELSRGMQQKVAIMIAILKNPEILVLDEPTLGLDIISQINMKQFLLDVVKNRGTTLIISTHDAALVNDVCEKIAIFHEGMLREYNTLDALKQATAYNGYRLSVQKSEDVAQKLRAANISYQIEGDIFNFVTEDLKNTINLFPMEDIVTIEKFGRSIEDIMIENIRGDA